MSPRSSVPPAIAFVLFVCLWVGLSIALKVTAADSAAYTSDLYDYHQALRNTAEGAFFRSYIYGNVMGDHGYLVLLLLFPVYLFLPSAGFWLLVVVTSLVAGLSTLLIRTILSQQGHPHSNVLAASLLLFPGIWWLTHEPIYGFHPDTLAAPLLALAAVGYAGRADGSTYAGKRIAMVAFTLFALLKEETALLAIIFALPFIADPPSRRRGLRLAMIAVVTAGLSFGVMAVSRTPFNRGNSTLIASWIERIVPWPGFSDAFPALVPLLIAGLLTILTLFGWRKWDVVDKAVALVVAAKIASLALVWDHLPEFSWHLAIPLAGGWFFLFRYLHDHAGWSGGAASAFVIAALLSATACVDGVWLIHYREMLQGRRVQAREAASARAAFAPVMERGVVSVPPYDLHAWRNDSATVLPRGLTLSPRGISDYVVTGAESLPTELEPFRRCLATTARTPARVLYARTGYCPFEDDRKLFDQLAGLP